MGIGALAGLGSIVAIALWASSVEAKMAASGQARAAKHFNAAMYLLAACGIAAPLMFQAMWHLYWVVLAG